MIYHLLLNHAAFALGALGTSPLAVQPFCASEFAGGLSYSGRRLAATATMIYGEQPTNTAPARRSRACMLCA